MGPSLNTKQVLGSVSLLDRMPTNIFLWQSLLTTGKQTENGARLIANLFQLSSKLDGQILPGGDYLKNSFSAVPLGKGVRVHKGFCTFPFLIFRLRANKRRQTMSQLLIRMCLGLSTDPMIAARIKWLKGHVFYSPGFFTQQMECVFSWRSHSRFWGTT